jgi:hypothetical protein
MEMDHSREAYTSTAVQAAATVRASSESAPNRSTAAWTVARRASAKVLRGVR